MAFSSFIDGDLIRSCGFCSEAELQGRLVELNNGCLCCTVQDDFLPTMEKLLDDSRIIDGIIIETSGLALPMPLLLRGVPKNDNYYPVKGNLPRKDILNILRSIYKQSSENELFAMLEVIQKRSSMSSYGNSSRDNTSLAYEAGEKLKNLYGPRVAVFEVDGFDTHAAQGANDGAHADCLGEMDSILGDLR